MDETKPTLKDLVNEMLKLLPVVITAMGIVKSIHYNDLFIAIPIYMVLFYSILTGLKVFLPEFERLS